MDQSWHLYKIITHCYLDTAFCDTALDLWPADNCVNQLVRLSAMLFKNRIPYVGLLFTNFLLSTRGNVYQIYEWVAKHAGLLRVYYLTAPRMSLCNRYLLGLENLPNLFTFLFMTLK